MQSPVRLVSPSLLTTTAALLYQGTADMNLTAASCTNTSGSPATLTMYFVPRGAVPGPANQVFTQSIPANSTVTLSSLLFGGGPVLLAGESIQASASTADVLTLLISGVPS
jgi:hypothetical protein